jgi:hypothetical protein
LDVVCNEGWEKTLDEPPRAQQNRLKTGLQTDEGTFASAAFALKRFNVSTLQLPILGPPT